MAMQLVFKARRPELLNTQTREAPKSPPAQAEGRHLHLTSMLSKNLPSYIVVEVICIHPEPTTNSRSNASETVCGPIKIGLG